MNCAPTTGRRALIVYVRQWEVDHEYSLKGTDVSISLWIDFEVARTAPGPHAKAIALSPRQRHQAGGPGDGRVMGRFRQPWGPCAYASLPIFESIAGNPRDVVRTRPVHRAEEATLAEG